MKAIMSVAAWIRGLFLRKPVQPSTLQIAAYERKPALPLPAFHCAEGDHPTYEWLGKPVTVQLDGERVTLPGLMQCMDCWAAGGKKDYQPRITEEWARAYLANRS